VQRLNHNAISDLALDFVAQGPRPRRLAAFLSSSEPAGIYESLSVTQESHSNNLNSKPPRGQSELIQEHSTGGGIVRARASSILSEPGLTSSSNGRLGHFQKNAMQMLRDSRSTHSVSATGAPLVLRGGDRVANGGKSVIPMEDPVPFWSRHQSDSVSKA